MEVVAAMADTIANRVEFLPAVTKTKRVPRRFLAKQTPSVAASDGSRSSTSSWASQASFKSMDSRGSRRGRKQWIRAEREILDDPYRSTWRPVRCDTGTSSLPYFCTWPSCSASFKFRWEWSRHEEAVHFQPYQWVCCLEGSETTPLLQCIICAQLSPTVGHIMKEHFTSCMGKRQNERTFLREDQLLQHINGVHVKARLVKKDCEHLLSLWKISNTSLPTCAHTCGFCGHVLPSWKDRQEHVYQHLKSGMCKSSWWPERLPRRNATNMFGISLHRDDGVRICLSCGFASEDEVTGIEDHCICSNWSCRYLHDYHHTIVDTSYWRGGFRLVACGLCEFQPSRDLYHDERTKSMNEHILTHGLRSCNQTQFSEWSRLSDHLVSEHGAIRSHYLDALEQFYVCEPRQECGSRARVF
jgi:hypothetical protein